MRKDTRKRGEHGGKVRSRSTEKRKTQLNQRIAIILQVK